VRAVVGRKPNAEPKAEIAFHASRVLLQDCTGVPALVNLAAMRDAIRELGYVRRPPYFEGMAQGPGVIAA